MKLTDLIKIKCIKRRWSHFRDSDIQNCYKAPKKGIDFIKSKPLLSESNAISNNNRNIVINMRRSNMKDSLNLLRS